MGYFDWHEQPGYFRRHAPLPGLDQAPGHRLRIGLDGRALCRLTGIDGSPEAVAAAAQKGRQVTLADVDQPLPFPDASFDSVVMKDLLEHIGDPVAIVCESRRVLRTGGHVFASSPDAQRWVWNDYTHRRPFTRAAFRRLFADNGLTVEHIGYESVMPGTSIVSARTRRKRRRRVLQAMTWLPVVRRNVWLVARKP